MGRSSSAAFSAEGPCPASASDLQECLLRFLCTSPDFGPLPSSAVGLNATVRRAFQRAGHERSSLSVFRADGTAEALRAIRSELVAKNLSAALLLEDSAEDLLILDADRGAIQRALLNGKERLPAVQATPLEPMVKSEAARGQQTSERKRKLIMDVDDELQQLLGEPMAKKEEPPAERERRRRRRSASGDEERSRRRRRRRREEPEEPEEPARQDPPLEDPGKPRSVSSVPLFQWVSASSITDLKPVLPEGQKRRRSRSAEHALARGERPEKAAGDLWEENREINGLKLLGDLAHGKPWSYYLKDEGRRSFAGYLPKALAKEECQSYFMRILSETEWQQPDGPLGALPRKTCWMTSKGLSCTYRYGGIEVPPQEFPEWMTELLATVMPLCGIHESIDWPNSCNLNLYEDGCMSVGWHADDERLFQGRFMDCRIISLSFGAGRRFELRLNWPEDGEKQVFQIQLGDGDLLTMEGMTQKHFQHRVPREENIKAPRINLTWRWVVKPGRSSK